MKSILIYIISGICNFYHKIIKLISIKIFETIPDNLFIFKNKDNIFIEKVFFCYFDIVLDVTNKFKWLYTDNIQFSELKQIYITMSPSSPKLEDYREHYFIIIHSKNEFVVMNISSNKYCVSSLENNIDDINFDIIPMPE